MTIEPLKVADFLALDFSSTEKEALAVPLPWQPLCDFVNAVTADDIVLARQVVTEGRTEHGADEILYEVGRARTLYASWRRSENSPGSKDTREAVSLLPLYK